MQLVKKVVLGAQPSLNSVLPNNRESTTIVASNLVCTYWQLTKCKVMPEIVYRHEIKRLFPKNSATLLQTLMSNLYPQSPSTQYSTFYLVYLGSITLCYHSSRAPIAIDVPLTKKHQWERLNNGFF